MTAWKNIARYTETAWPRRKSALPEALAEMWEAALASCGEEEALLLRALLATLPLSDLGDYSPGAAPGCSPPQPAGAGGISLVRRPAGGALFPAGALPPGKQRAAGPLPGAVL